MAKSLLKKDTEQLSQEETTLEDYISNLIGTNLCSTIGIKFDSIGTVLVNAIYQNSVKLIKFNHHSKDSYLSFCEDLLKLKRDEKFNSSTSILIKGIKVRVFALMPPLCETPDITISTTKLPPSKWSQSVYDDELFDRIVHSNFIISGASGSGKTYLMNYLLSKFIGKNERIAFIEEFSELIPPNEATSCIIVPPPKPDEESLLKFVTQQSNLMRLDAFYVGEVKGAEAWPMVVNMASGTRGGCTVHGDNVQQTLNRLKVLCSIGGADMSIAEELIAKSIKFVISVQNHGIREIQMLTGIHQHGTFQSSAVQTIDDLKRLEHKR